MGRAPFTLLHLFIFLLIFIPITLRSQSSVVNAQEKFNKLMLQAFQDGSEELKTNLVQKNRLLVKPFIEAELRNSIIFLVEQDNNKARKSLEMCAEVANTFQHIFAENSLNIAVDYIKNWDLQQKKTKLIADSLYESATRQRNKRSTRNEALDNYQHALELFKSLGDRRGEAATLGGLGVVYWYKRDREKVLDYFQQALIVRQEVDDQQLIGNTFSDLASFYRSFLKDYAKSNEYYRQAIRIRSDIGDHIGLAKCYRFCAENYWDLGELPTALSFFNKATDLFVSKKDSINAGKALHNSGILLRRMGRYPESLEQFKRALSVREAVGDFRSISATLIEMGTVYKKLGDFESALKQYQKQLYYFEGQEDHRGMVQCLINIGTILSQLNRPEQALEYYKKAETIEEKSEERELILEIWSNIGVAYYELGNTHESVKYHQNAIDLSRQQKNLRIETNNLINLGNTYTQSGSLDSAVSCFHSAKVIAEKLNDPALLWPVFLGLGDNYENRKQYEKALEYYQLALQQIENIHTVLSGYEYQADFLANQRYIYEAIVAMISNMHQQDKSKNYHLKAFEFSEQAKAREFLNLMAEALADVREGADPVLLQTQEDLLDQITNLHNLISRAAQNGESVDSLKLKLTAAEEQYRIFKNQIKRQNPKYASLQFPEIISIPEIQNNYLSDSTIVLAYLVGDSSSILWAITQNDAQLCLLPSREKIHEQIELMRYSLLNPDQKKYDLIADNGFKLYQTLLAPVESIIQPGFELVIIPDDILHTIPFEVLVTQQVDSLDLNLPYLFRKNPISYFPSASVMSQIIAEQKKQKYSHDRFLLAIGDPEFTKSDFTGQSLSPLPYSGEEVKYIAGLCPDERNDILLREKAREDTLKSMLNVHIYRYIHFATHGIIDDKKPDFSSIVLSTSDTSEENGLLMAAEIFNLPIHADLAVLSACESGLGKMVRGEGIIGLTRAFMYAGTPSVIATLWRVADVSTSEFMKEFYSKLIVEGKSKSQALRSARFSLLNNKKFAHPFYWAPFVLIGRSN